MIKNIAHENILLPTNKFFKPKLFYKIMNDNSLLKLSLICSLIGIFILIIISERIDISQSNIANITKNDVDKSVKIKGYITRLTETPGLYIMNIKDSTAEITTIVFKEDKINITRGSLVEVEWKVKEYN